MTRFSLILIMGLLLPFCMKAQTASVEGKVMDTTNQKPLQNAVISIINASDSVLVDFTRSDKNGHFSLSKVAFNNYILLISYPTFGDFVDKITIDKPNYNLNEIILTPKAKLLEAVIIKQQSIRIKGDTTEYLADSFKVRPNASVEDLLKELPGLQVDKDGKITAQGETVQKVLVDGEEFFSDDPTIATKNLRADAVKKVQVFDKKSEESEFTGIDDGKKTKTINLELKESAKSGYFGKVSAGGLDRYYNLQAMINAFKSKRKLAAFAIASSTSETGLDWQNAGNYGFNSSNMEVDGTTGSISISSSSGGDLGSGSFNGRGLPESIKSGLHFSNKWDENKYNFSSNYLFNKLAVRARSNDFSQNILVDSVYYNRENSETHSDRSRHNVAASMDIQIDSSSSLKVTANGYIGTNDYNTTFQTENISEDNILINKNNRINATYDDNRYEYLYAIYRKKFKKQGQSFYASASQGYNETKGTGWLNSRSDFFDPTGQFIKFDTTDQRKISNNQSSNWVAGAGYTHPLSSKSYLLFNYAYSNNSSNQEKLSYNKDGNAKYTELVDSLSNNYKYIYSTNRAGLNYRYAGKKTNFTVGANVAKTVFHQNDLFKDTSRQYSYVNFYPKANFVYKFSSYKNLRIDYNGSTKEPTIDQLQPLKDNSDPLDIVIGNPNLKQSFTHSVNVFYTDFKILSERYLYLGGNYNLTENNISRSYNIDHFGKRVSQYINTDGNYTLMIFGGINFKVPKSKFRIGAGPVIGIYQYTNFINNVKNVTNTANLSWRLNVGLSDPTKYQFRVEYRPSYNTSKSNISTVANTKYWTNAITGNGYYVLPAKFEIGSDVAVTLRQKTTNFDNNNNRVLWNAYVEKKFMKSEALTLRISIHDILDQNKGYERYETGTAVMEQRYLTFGQYGLITLTYNFVNKGGKAPKSDRSGIIL